MKQVSEIGKKMLAFQEKLAAERKYAPVEIDLFVGDVREKYRAALPEWCKEGGDLQTPLYTLDDTQIATGYQRVVIGDYGAFVEISPEQIRKEALRCKPGQEYRFAEERFAANVKYLWLTAKDRSDCKIYFQKKEVNYADYIPGIRSANYNPFPVYALQPEGEPLLETEYEGYGEFGGQDIYDLVADWNRKYLSEHPDFLIIQHIDRWSEQLGMYLTDPPKKVCEYDWYPVYAALANTREDIEREMRKLPGNKHFLYRSIGVDIACYDDQNFQLPFPIKLVEIPVPYAAAEPSKGDPNQGWGDEY